MSMTVADQRAEQEQPRQCAATAKTTGERCQRPIEPPATVCGLHGGKSPGARKRKLAYEALDALYDPNADPVTDPVAELQRLGGICSKALDVCGAKVAQIEKWDDYDAKGTAQLKGVVQLMLQLMRLSESILTTLAKLGIDERRVQLQEREADAVVRLLDTVRDAAELQLSAAQRQAWDVVVGRELQALTAE